MHVMRPAHRSGRRGMRARPAAAGMAALLLVLAPALTGCRTTHDAVSATGRSSMELTSSSIRDSRIPKDFTCDGADRSPRLAWTAAPAATKSIALLVTDPDAPKGTWVHWVLYNLPAAARELPEGLPKHPQLADGSLQGRNDFGNIGYGGPCPPRGSTHRYVFDLYALDAPLDLPPGATRNQVESAMKGHVLDTAKLIARYGR